MNFPQNRIKDYINENYLNENYLNENYLNKSAWDIEYNIEDDNKEFILNEIKKFIDDNYKCNISQECEIVFDEKKDKYVVNCKEPVVLKSNSKQIANGMFEWGTVWNFDCSRSLITSLEGVPKEVGGDFRCYKCNELTSLQGAPETVGRDFYCYSCAKLESLKGAPKEISGCFDCHKCPELKSLEGTPKEVGGWFNCYKCIELTSLQGAPKEIGGCFECRDCPKLSSLDGVGQVGGEIFSDIK